jgi:tetratricopeptide (TPR) repeat protein
VDLVNVVEMNQDLEGDPYAWGPYCYMLENPFWFQQPIPCPGQVTLFNLPADLVTEVKAQLAKPPRTLSEMDALRKAIRPTEVDVLWGRANEFLEAGALADAGEFLNALATTTPQDAEVFAVRAHVRWTLGDLRGALRDFNKVLRLDDGDLEAFLEKGAFLLEMGFLDQALECCQFVTSQARKREAELAASGFLLIARINLLRGELEAALEAFSRAIALNPKDLDSRSRRGFLNFMLGRKVEADQDFAESARLRKQLSAAERVEDED